MGKSLNLSVEEQLAIAKQTLATALPYLKQLQDREQRNHSEQVHPSRGRAEYMGKLAMLIELIELG